MLPNSPLTPLVADPLALGPIVPPNPLDAPLALRIASRSEPPLIAVTAALATIVPDPGPTPLPRDILELFGLIDPKPQPQPVVLPDRWEVTGLGRLAPIGVSAQPLNLRPTPISVAAQPINVRISPIVVSATPLNLG
jgi:hypothetical protein